MEGAGAAAREVPSLFLALAIAGVVIAAVGALAARGDARPAGGPASRLWGPRPEHRWTDTKRMLFIAFGLYVTTFVVGGLALSLRPTNSLIVRTIVGGAYLVVPALFTLRTVLDSERQPVVSKVHRIALGLAGGLAAFGLAFFLLQLVQTVGAPLGWEPREQAVVQILRKASGRDTAFLVAYAVCVAPFVEEVLYRGLLLPALARNMRLPTALVLQALIFGAMHFSLDPAQLPLALPLAAVGWCAGYLYHRTGSLLSAVLVHATFNAVQLLGMFFA